MCSEIWCTESILYLPHFFSLLPTLTWVQFHPSCFWHSLSHNGVLRLALLLDYWNGFLCFLFLVLLLLLLTSSYCLCLISSYLRKKMLNSVAMHIMEILQKILQRKNVQDLWMKGRKKHKGEKERSQIKFVLTKSSNYFVHILLTN